MFLYKILMLILQLVEVVLCENFWIFKIENKGEDQIILT